MLGIAGEDCAGLAVLPRFPCLLLLKSFTPTPLSPILPFRTALPCTTPQPHLVHKLQQFRFYEQHFTTFRYTKQQEPIRFLANASSFFLLPPSVLTPSLPPSPPPLLPFYPLPQALERLRRTHGGGGSSSPAPSASVPGQRGADGMIIATPGQAFLTGLLSGAVAGITVDLTLFPLDTIKTRLQASANTKFSLDLLKGVYDGVGPGLLASAPACAAFFGAYDSFKRSLTARYPDPKLAPIVNMLAAAGGDLTQSVVRVPFEVGGEGEGGREGRREGRRVCVGGNQGRWVTRGSHHGCFLVMMIKVEQEYLCLSKSKIIPISFTASSSLPPSLPPPLPPHLSPPPRW